uniref:Retrovirus-related Pol polyprotein from transposon TNT 1-94 n=1 Tax=Tanacetum cinerariifolium TaxID=118510 RepID=A0A6L2JK03_TANCI|nr:retrovirus-related Pol polyprotein from transposon TNT 1-94 [Tanacetum cinerariifolium]
MEIQQSTEHSNIDDHPLSYALSASAYVLAVCSQQFWKTVSMVPDTKDPIMFKLDSQEITYNRIGYQGVVDKYKKNVITYPRFIKLIICDLMKKYPSIPKRLDEDYHSIKDDIPLSLEEERKQVSREACSPRKSLKVTIKQNQVVEGDKDERSYANKFAASMLDDDVNDFGNKLDPGSHKENPKVIDDDYVNDDEQKDEKKNDVGIHEMGSLENRTEKLQTPIPTTLRSHWINLSSDKTIVQELTDMVSPQLPLHPESTEGKTDFQQVQSSSRATNDFIEGNLKRVMADTVIQERDVFQSEVPAPISKEFNAYVPKIIEDLFNVQTNVIQVHPTIITSTDTTSSADLQQQLKLKMKSNHQDHANDPALWDQLKRKFEKSSISNTSCRNDDFHSQHHDDHQDDDAPPEREREREREKNKQNTSLIYLNNKNEKRVMYMVEIAKFCDATLEKVLQEVKLKIFQTEFWKKPPLLGSELGNELTSLAGSELGSELTFFAGSELDLASYRTISYGTLREILTEGTEGVLHLGPERPRVYSNLTSEEKDKYNADIRATNILLQGLPKDIYSLINHYTNVKDICDNVKMLLEGSKLIKEDRESQLYDDFEHFRQHKGETIYDYFVRFAKLINDMRNIKMTMSRMQLNSKFVNNMLPEWGRFVTAVKLNRGLRDSNYDQLYAYLKQHENRGQGNNARGAGAGGDRGAQNRVGYANPGQARQIKCYNCNGIGHIARNYTQPKRPQNSEYFKDKVLLMQAQENEVTLDEE